MLNGGFGILTLIFDSKLKGKIDMKVEVIDYKDNWQAVKNAAMNTIGSEDGKYPGSAWKRKILLAEHSPIRLLRLKIRITDVPYYVVMHLVRHKVGIEHWVESQRTDRTGIDRDVLPQAMPISYTFEANAQAFIAISRKRLCAKADPATRDAWSAVIKAVRQVEPELASVCRPDCIYRGFCPEMRPCGYAESGAGQMELQCYRNGIDMMVVSS